MTGDITELLQAHGAGGRQALSRLVPLVYDDLRRIASPQMRRGARGATLDTGRRRRALHDSPCGRYDGHSLISAAIDPSCPFTVREGTRLFGYAPFGGRLGPDYDVAADDRRFLMIRSGGDTPATRLQLVLVQNWIEELKTKLRLNRPARSHARQVP